MLNFLSRHVERIVLPTPTISLFLLLIVVQCAVWYPFIKGNLDEVDQVTKAVLHHERARQKQEHQRQHLVQANFLQGSAVQGAFAPKSLLRGKAGTEVVWRLLGETSLVEWQSIQERVEDGAALQLIRAHWVLKPNGWWFGDLMFRVVLPQKHHAFSNWLPVRLHHPLLNKQWQLVTIIKEHGQRAALLKLNAETRWVNQGDWLPAEGFSIASISANTVSFVSIGGDVFFLSLYGEKNGEQKDDQRKVYGEARHD